MLQPWAITGLSAPATSFAPDMAYTVPSALTATSRAASPGTSAIEICQLKPMGANRNSIALVPGLAAREVAVSALGTVYAMSGTKDVAGALSPVIAHGWSCATGLSLLAWYVFAPGEQRQAGGTAPAVR